MIKSSVPGGVTILATMLSMSPALAQQAEVRSIHGVAGGLPYTISYPSVLEIVDDGSEVTVVTLRHPEAVLQCDALVQEGASSGWSADKALESLDVGGIVTTWAPDFPGFRVTSHGLTRFQSGPALMFEADSDGSPLGAPLHIIHVEAADGSRQYALECLVDKAAATQARPMIDFIIANFSTQNDGGCCVDPSDPRG